MQRLSHLPEVSQSEAAACNKEGIDAFFPILRNVCTLAEAMDPATAKNNMTATAEQVFRLAKAI
ncbi:MAG: glycerate kinase [Blautia faecis]